METTQSTKILCERCGQEIAIEVYRKRILRQEADSDLCRDCRDVKNWVAIRKRFSNQNKAFKKIIMCILHTGELDADWNPIDSKGVLVLPGVRVCGFRDCVSPSHILQTDANVKVQSSRDWLA